MEQDQTSSLFQLNLDASNSYTLRSAASWAKVLGILGIIFGVFFFIVAFMVQTALNNASSELEGFRSRNTSLAGSIGMAVYICFGIITIIGSIFAINFGNKISAALRTNDQNYLRSGFAGLRNYFAFWGVLMIIGLLLMILGIAGGGIGRM